MPAQKIEAEESLDRVIKQAVAAPLKPLGFKKRGRLFHRRHKEVVQVAEVQVSHGSTHDEKSFYVNIGLAFDAICRLTNRPVIETPASHECDERGTGGRLEDFYAAALSQWSVSTLSDAERVTSELRRIVETATVDFQQIGTIADYRRHPWFDRFRPKPENAQVFYLLGETESARSEIQRLCELFADRLNGDEPSFWIEQLGLSGLAMN